MPPIDPALIDAFGEVAENETLEPAFRAQVLQLPGEADIAREIGRDVDPQAIATARNRMRAEIARRLGHRLAALVDRYTEPAPFSPDAAAAGKRALANTALDLLVAGRRAGSDRTRRRPLPRRRQHDRPPVGPGDPDPGGAARAPARRSTPSTTATGATPLVLDKWFALAGDGAGAGDARPRQEPAAAPRLRATNPNRIRSLIGAFASGNQTQFNRPDGAGYEFLADFVLDLDRRNPQTAARLLVSFRSWRALEEGRRARAEHALRRVAAAQNLSPDTRDIVTRTLA